MELAKEAKEYKETHKLKYYSPYEYQIKFHKLGLDHPQRLLMAANRVGKTECGAAELAYHLTGLYPDWWGGRVFKKPIKAWASGVNNDKTRDIVQGKLCGTPGNPQHWGKGYLPKDCLGDYKDPDFNMRKPGVPNALQQVMVKHISGEWSLLAFKSYEMESVGFYGESIDCVWLDEEPNQSIYSQALTRVVDRAGLVFMTFTPEMGVTQVVGSFMNDLKSGQALIHATWEDVSEEKGGHLNRKAMDQILSAYHPSERDLRTKGVPVLGSGLVYPVSEDSILVDPFPIPDYYQIIGGLDPGDDHPTAVSWIARNVDTDTIYVYDCYRERRQDIIYHAEAVKARGKWIPIMWPHDANRKNGYGGPSLADMYRRQGVKMHWEKFTNPPVPGQTEGQGGNEIMPGIQEILTRMRTGRFKVFKTLTPWLEEFRMYHLDPKTGKPVDKGDDLMQSTRYAVQMLRFAQTKKYTEQSDKIVYKKLGIV